LVNDLEDKNKNKAMKIKKLEASLHYGNTNLFGVAMNKVNICY